MNPRLETFMKREELAQEVSTRSCAFSVCESCGAEFSCGAAAQGCWCSEVKLTEEGRARLSERYGSCLCRACLEQFAAERPE
jgi:hypothetical protein